MNAAIEGLVEHQYDAVITGGIDRNMGRVAGFVKFCKIGALSATGTRPFDAGADGFVMGEGAALFVLKRSGRRRARRRPRLCRAAAASPAPATARARASPRPTRLGSGWRWSAPGRCRRGPGHGVRVAIEAHGTSTRVGDATELRKPRPRCSARRCAAARVALGSVKSNIGHLKAAAGAAGMFKMATMALHHKVLPPSFNFVDPQPQRRLGSSRRSGQHRAARVAGACAAGCARRGVSAFGFGGTNFHVVLEEHVPGRRKHGAARLAQVASAAATSRPPVQPRLRRCRGRCSAGSAAAVASVSSSPIPRLAPLRGALVLGGQ
jgi:acyl transferase domain-containing protein